MSKLKYISTYLLVIIFSFSLIGCSFFSSSKTNNQSIEDTQSDSEEADDSDSEIIDTSSKSSINAFRDRTFDDSFNLTNNDIGVPVLYYHSVRDTAENEVTISKDMLKEQLQYIKNEGYTTLTMAELSNYLLNNSPIPEKSIVITFDDGYMDNYTNAFPILKDLNMTATIFCITSGMSDSYYLSPQCIKEMYDYGIDIESHTVNHVHLNTLSYNEQLKEMKDSKDALEKITQSTVTSIAFPYGDYNADSIKAAKDAGYSLAFTTNLGRAHRSNNPLELNRVYINSNYDFEKFKSILNSAK